jgi:hypothetical protein
MHKIYFKITPFLVSKRMSYTQHTTYNAKININIVCLRYVIFTVDVYTCFDFIRN